MAFCFFGRVHFCGLPFEDLVFVILPGRQTLFSKKLCSRLGAVRPVSLKPGRRGIFFEEWCSRLGAVPSVTILGPFLGSIFVSFLNILGSSWVPFWVSR